MEAAIIERINLLPRAQAISVGDSVFSEEQRQFIAEIYKSVLGKDIPKCSCRHRYSDALEEICFTIKIKPKMRKYQLKAGVIIWIGTEVYSNVNLTDEVAEEYLKRFPEAREKEFQKWPEENKEDQEKVEAAKKTLAESEKALEEEEPKLTEESVGLIIACQNTLKECIVGGDTTNIISAEEGLKNAWKQAEAKTTQPEPKDGAGQTEGEGSDATIGNEPKTGEEPKEGEEETQGNEKPSKAKKGK